MTVPNFKCICDANIWVNVCLGDSHESYIERFSTIGVVDAVKNEILRWNIHEGRFRKIFTFFLEYENKGLSILDKNSIDVLTKRIIERDLIQWGFKDTDNSSKTIDDLGEYVSLLYAYHLEIPYIHTEDTTFMEGIEMDGLYSQYKGIEMITWNQVASDITDSESERLALNQKVILESKEMERQYKKIKGKRDLENKIMEFNERYSSR